MSDIIKSHYKRFSKFALVGVLNTLVDYLIYCLFVYVFSIYYLFSHVIAFVTANINSYIFNSLWTFQQSEKTSVLRRFIPFFIVSLIGLGLSTLVLYLSVESLKSFLHNYYPDLLGKIIASFASLFWNYFASYFFVFGGSGPKDKN